MGDVIGDFLPAAVGIAISPVPIVAVVLMLVSARGRANGPAFLVGWVVGVAGLGAVMLVAASAVGGSEDGEPATWVSWLKLALGVSLLYLAVGQWRGRPRGDAEASTPTWMESVDHFSPPKAAGAGFVLSALNPKNLVLTIAGMAAIAEAGLPAGEQAIALVVFTAVASIGAAVPIVLYFTLGERSAEPLGRLKTWMARNNAVVMTVLLVVIGAKVVGDAIAGLT